jgi:hypothetical protein
MAGFGAYGQQTYDGINAEHESTRRQKQDWAQQQADAQQQQQVNWNQGREMFERGLIGQEQARKQYDSQTARDASGQKYSVLGGLLQGLVQGNAAGASPYGGGMDGYRTTRRG